MDLPRAFSSVPIICAAGSDFWSVCSLCVNMLREASRPLISSEMFQLQLSTQNGCNGFPFSTFIHKEWHMKKVDRCMQAICISFYSEEPDSSCKSSSEPGFFSGSSESGVSSWRTTLNPNADPGANADSISPSDWVVWISGFTFRFSWFISSKSVSYLPVTGFFFLPSVIWTGIHLLDKFFNGDAQYFLKNEFGDPALAKHLQQDAAGYLKDINSTISAQLVLKEYKVQTERLCSAGLI